MATSIVQPGFNIFNRGRIGLLLFGLLALVGCSLLTPPESTSGDLIADVRTDKARYAPGTPVEVVVALHNRSPTPFAGQIVLMFYHLGNPLADRQTQTVASLAVGASSTVQFTWTPPPTDYTGYRVEVQALDRRQQVVLDMDATAVDVSSDWKKFPRYGFVSQFAPTVDAQAVIAKLNAYHINGLQFYDWQWQHHRPYSPQVVWPDIANRHVSRATVTKLIDAAHDPNMVAMSYNLAFGAYDNYWQDGSGAQTGMGLFKSGNGPYTPEQQDFHPLPANWATGKLFLMNPANPAWQDYIFQQEQAMFDNFAFDGWHIDTLGRRGFLYDADGKLINMPAAFVDFATKAKAALGKRIVFNTVGGYGQDEIAANVDVDFIYSEVWENDNNIWSYADLGALAKQARAKTDKAVVLPAYMNRRYAQAAQGNPRFFGEPSVRLTDAAIFTAGATHLELGDGDAMLSSEYFPSQQLVMSDTLQGAMRANYDFLVAYENLLLDDIADSDNAVIIEGIPTSPNGKPGTVWTKARTRPGFLIVHLINLKNNRVTLWRDEMAVYPAPTTLLNLDTKLYYTGELRQGARLWYASPDSDHGKAQPLTYTTGSDAQGTFVAFMVPQLQYWDMLWLEQ